MSSKQKQIPAVRFNGFTEAWEQRKFSDLIQTMRGGASIAPDDYKDNGVATVPKGAINSTGIADLSGSKYVSKEFFEKNKNSSVYSDELVTSLRDLVPSAPNMGRIVKLKGKDKRYLMPQGVYNLILLDEVDENFLISFSNTSKFRRIISQEKNGSTQVHIRNSEYLGISIDAPDAEEQNKIGSFFKKLDVTIALHQRQLDNCKQLKNSMMQKIFNQELRFKDENGKDYPEWQKYDLSEIVDRVTRKNTGLISELPLTISAQYGLVDQLTFFNKTIAGVNLEAYYLLKNGEFAYNKSYSSGYPLGAIKRLDKYDAGLLSTLYICFSPRNNVDSDFLTQYFESTKWHKQIVNISGEGARNHGLLNIAVGDFFNTEHILPCKEEQQQIATLLYSLDNMIDLSTRKVDSLNEQKKELMKRMFV